jgi:hypothetical protein
MSTFSEVSAEGVPAPDPPAGLIPAERLSPARRSPQVRESQRLRTRRPDLLPVQRSDR